MIKTMQTLIFDEMKEFQWKRDQLLASNATSKRLIRLPDRNLLKFLFNYEQSFRTFNSDGLWVLGNCNCRTKLHSLLPVLSSCWSSLIATTRENIGKIREV